MNVFFFGMGFSSQVSGRAIRALDVNATISGTTRSAGTAAALAASGVRAHIFDGARPGETLGADLLAASHVVFSIAPTEMGDPALIRHRAELDAAPALEWLCYYSTVGVYGDFGGAWIDENAPLVPRNARSDRRVLAENAWRAYAAGRGVPLALFRLAGIYGPGRSTFERLVGGTARRVVKPGQVFNRIHVADIARVTALAAHERLDGTFNLADDEPAPPQDVVGFAAGLAGVAPPPEVPFESAEMTLMARSFYGDNKRVCNGAIKTALGIDMLYPSYREGLTAIFRER